MTTMLYKSRQPATLSGSLNINGELCIPINKLKEYTGLELKPEGVCIEETCIPLNNALEKEIVIHDQNLFNITVFSKMVGDPIVHDSKQDVWVISEGGFYQQTTGTISYAPDFTLPDIEGVEHSLSSYLGKKIFLVSWASWCGCRFDLPVWQSLYEELKDDNFIIIAVAFDTGGRSAVKEWIDKANPTYPCLIDKNHIVAGLYHMVNVPNAVWINEQGKIVRVAEPAGWNDGWRTDNLSGLEKSKDTYFNALRDWVQEGNASKHVLPAKEGKNKMSEYTYEKALAEAHFKMGIYLTEYEQVSDAKVYFNKAIKLHPESWNFKRQSWSLIESKEEQRNNFREAIKELEDKPYYPRLQFDD